MRRYNPHLSDFGAGGILGAITASVTRTPAQRAAYDRALKRGEQVLKERRDVLRIGDTITARTDRALNRVPQMSSKNRQAWLILQSDGNLVLSTPEGKVLWSSKTQGTERIKAVEPAGKNLLDIVNANAPKERQSKATGGLLGAINAMNPTPPLPTLPGARRFTLQADGNLVLLNDAGKPIWASGTNRPGGLAAWGGNPPYLSLQDDGNLVLYSAKTPLWSTGSNGFKNRQDETTWLSNAVKTAGKAVGGVIHEIADVSSSIADTVGKVPFVGPGLKGLYGYSYGALIASADNVAQGVRLDKVASRHFESQIENVRQVAPYVQTVIALVPGIGPGIAGAVSAGLSLAQGKPIDQALIDAAMSSLPGGALAQMAGRAAVAVAQGKPLSDVAVNAMPMPDTAKEALKATLRVASDLAQGKRVDASLAAEANRQMEKLPPGVRDAAKVGIALGQGQKIQEVAMNALPAMVAQSGPLVAAGSKIAASNPAVQSARALVGRATQGFDVATGLLAHTGVNRAQITKARQLLTPENKKSFDMGVALHVSRVTSKPAPKHLTPAEAAGYHITKGLQGAPVGNKVSIAKTLVSHPEAKSGAGEALLQITQTRVDAANANKTFWQKFKEFFGFHDTAHPILASMPPSKQFAAANAQLKAVPVAGAG
jgi:hypothetical protein